jgi:hypothetical protein
MFNQIYHKHEIFSPPEACAFEKKLFLSKCSFILNILLEIITNIQLIDRGHVPVTGNYVSNPIIL